MDGPISNHGNDLHPIPALWSLISLLQMLLTRQRAGELCKCSWSPLCFYDKAVCCLWTCICQRRGGVYFNTQGPVAHPSPFCVSCC
jgi:hypothetical protein